MSRIVIRIGAGWGRSALARVDADALANVGARCRLALDTLLTVTGKARP